jgi:hypothetical protein
MSRALHGVGAVVLRMLSFAVFVTVGEHIGHAIVPPPPGFDHHDAAAVRALPMGTSAALLLSWAMGTFAGAWEAARLAPAGKLVSGLAVALFGLLGAVTIMSMMPHPFWMWLVAVAVFLPVAYLGATLAARRTRPLAMRTR